MQADEIVWKPDLDLDPEEGEAATVGQFRLGVWRNAHGQICFDVWNTSSDTEVIDGAVFTCSGDAWDLARRLAALGLQQHLAQESA